MEGKKHDSGKRPMSLVPVDAKRLLADVLAFGADKYDPWNWARGMKWSRLIDAAYRHLDSWAEGEDKDPETGLSHLGHLLCCAAFLAVYELRGIGQDDRQKWEESKP